MKNALSPAQETPVRDIIRRKEGEVPSYASDPSDLPLYACKRQLFTKDLAKISDFYHL